MILIFVPIVTFILSVILNRKNKNYLRSLAISMLLVSMLYFAVLFVLMITAYSTFFLNIMNLMIESLYLVIQFFLIGLVFLSISRLVKKQSKSK